MSQYCHCGRPAALRTGDGAAFFVPCWSMFQQTIQENQRQHFAYMNFLMDEMGFLSGSGAIGPRINIPQPTYVKNMNTTNNIKLEPGSQVGQINAGAIVYLNKAVSTFKDVGQGDIAVALQQFTQQVVDSRELSAASQKQILDVLQYLIQELATKKQAERNSSVLKLTLQSIGPLLTAGTAIANHWEKLKHILQWIL